MPQLKKMDTRIGRKIRLRRVQLRMEAKSLAAYVKIMEARLKEVEAGRERVGAELLADIAGALGVSSAYFYSAPRSGLTSKRQSARAS